jgi:hypothetical protein
MAGTRTGFRIWVWWSAHHDDDGYASFPGNQKRFNVAIFNALPETDLFFRIQLTPVLRIVLFSHTIPRLCCTEGANGTETGIAVF